MIGSSEPITVTISHRLGRDEAKRRIDSGLGSIRKDIAQFVRSLDYDWDGYTLNFRASAMMQTITGRLEIYEESIRVELGLPRLLHLLAKTVAGQIEQRGSALLQGPKK